MECTYNNTTYDWQRVRRKTCRDSAAVRSALPDRGVQVGKILMLHGVVGAHPSLWVAHEQTLCDENTLRSNAYGQTVQLYPSHAEQIQRVSKIFNLV